MKDKSSPQHGSPDPVIVHDRPGRRPGRRQFIRSGAALLFAGGVVSKPALADCDSGGNGGEKKPGQAGSDSDSGTSADPAGCGKRPEKPKLTRRQQISSEKVTVATIKADKPKG